MIVDSGGDEMERSYTPGTLGEAKTEPSGGTGPIIRSASDYMFEEPIGLAPAPGQFDNGNNRTIESVTEDTRRKEAISNAQSADKGVCGPYCPATFPGSLRPLTFTLLVILSIFILFTFCALCVSGKKLSSGKVGGNKIQCGHSNIYISGTKLSYNSDTKANDNAGNVFVTFGVFAFLLELVMLVFVLDFDYKFLKDKIPFSTRLAHLVMTIVLWVLLTISWGTWSNQRTDFCDEVPLGDATNLLITVWFFLHFYIALSIEYVQKRLFGGPSVEYE